ncbi:hypothetical protein BVY03_01485 [bacterium K02(2017)]|nr:hypothetical protein BVY03_01485 [bacterium K02(2017)]
MITSAKQISTLYNNAKYLEIINKSELAPLNLQADQQLYYAALSYVKLKNYVKAKETLLILLERDPSFYRYRIDHDYELWPLLNQTSFSSIMQTFYVGQIWDEALIKGHKIVQTDKSLFLYRNGKKIFLSEDKSIIRAGFIDPDRIFLLKGTVKNTQQIVIFDALKEQITFERIFEKPLSNLRFSIIKEKLLLQSNQGFLILNNKNYLPLSQFQLGFFKENESL